MFSDRDAKLAVASQTLGDGALAPIDRVCESAGRRRTSEREPHRPGSAPGKRSISASSSAIAGEGPARLGFRQPRALRLARGDWLIPLGSLVEDLAQLLDLGMELGLAGAGRSLELGQHRP